MPNIKGFVFICKNWKLAIHLLLHTKRFGVNNKWHSEFESILSTDYKGFSHLLINYRALKIRATACGFLTREECKNLGWKSTI